MRYTVSSRPAPLLIMLQIPSQNDGSSSKDPLEFNEGSDDARSSTDMGVSLLDTGSRSETKVPDNGRQDESYRAESSSPDGNEEVLSKEHPGSDRWSADEMALGYRPHERLNPY